jgi:predicted ester cyclase
MSTAANKAIVVQLYEEIFNKGNLDLADHLVAPNAVNHDPAVPPGIPSNGPQGLKSAVTMLRSAFPDDHHTIEDLIAEGDKVVVRLTHSGTHQGNFMGLAPTGKHITNTAIYIFRFASGQLVEYWGNRDDLGLLQQLEAIPATGQ